MTNILVFTLLTLLNLVCMLLSFKKGNPKTAMLNAFAAGYTSCALSTFF